MRWLISFAVFGSIVAGFFHTSVAADHKDGHGGGDKRDHYYHTLGVKQPPAVREKGTAPAKAQLTSPKALSKIPAGSVSLRWVAVPGAEVYHVQVAKDPRFMWLITDKHDVKGESFEASGLEAGQQYFWRVAARRPDNDAGWTKGAFTASSFETQ